MCSEYGGIKAKIFVILSDLKFLRAPVIVSVQSTFNNDGFNIFSPLNVTLTFITVAFVIPTIVGKKAFGLKCNFAIRYGFKKETYIFYKPVE